MVSARPRLPIRRASSTGRTPLISAVAEPMAEASALRAELMSHPIYRRVTGPRAARVFMSHHVFAVWDFMSLLKSLQRKVTCVDVPWIPPVDAEAARLVNEIVLGEESDQDGKGGYAGHYDLYLEAMAHVGADTEPIDDFVNALRAGLSVQDAVVQARVPGPAAEFMASTLQIAARGEVHQVAAAFFFGRESIIPQMFDQLRASLDRIDARLTERLGYYLSRHIEVDGDTHGPAAERLLVSLCGGSEEKWAQANSTACASLRARARLWDGVVAALDREGL